MRIEKVIAKSSGEGFHFVCVGLNVLLNVSVELLDSFAFDVKFNN